eukprot:m.1368388 g.1368388  ORF g.1368388 m.1368388 type:complete len:506 (-) comp24954_c1_seq18:4114-5631(-)
MQITGVMISAILQLIVKVPKDARRVFTCAIAYGNCGSLPLVVVETLSRQEPLVQDKDALDKLTTFIFLYLVGWFLSFWSCGLVYLVNGLDASAAQEESAVILNPILSNVLEKVDMIQESVLSKHNAAWTIDANTSEDVLDHDHDIQPNGTATSPESMGPQDIYVCGMLLQLSGHTSDVGASPPTTAVFDAYEQNMFACSLPGAADGASSAKMIRTHNAGGSSCGSGDNHFSGLGLEARHHRQPDAASVEQRVSGNTPLSTATEESNGTKRMPAISSRSQRSCQSQILYALFNPLMSAVWLGLFVGLIRPVQSVFFDSDAELAFVASALETLGKPAIGVITLLMSASLGGFLDKNITLRAARRRAKQEESKNIASTELNSTKSNHAASVGASMPPAGDSKTKEVPTSVLVALALGRCILFPAVNLCLVFYFADSILPDSADRKYMKLVLAIESATPSADTIIVVCMQYGHREIAEVLAASYLLQYFIDMLPLAVAIGVSLSSFFES